MDYNDAVVLKYSCNIFKCTGIICEEYIVPLPYCKIENPYVHVEFKRPGMMLFFLTLEIRELYFVTNLESS